MMSATVDMEVLIEHIYFAEARITDPVVKLLAKSPIIEAPMGYDSDEDSSDDDEGFSRQGRENLSQKVLELSDDSELDDSDDDDDIDEDRVLEGDDDDLDDDDDETSDDSDTETSDEDAGSEDAFSYQKEDIILDPTDGGMSVLTQMMRSSRSRYHDSRNPPTPASLGMFAARAARGNDSGTTQQGEFVLTVFVATNDLPAPQKMELRAVHGATVDQVIRMVIRTAPKAFNLVNDSQAYIVRMVEDDGTPDDDMPALDRSREIQKFLIEKVALCNNPAWKAGEGSQARRGSIAKQMGPQARLNVPPERPERSVATSATPEHDPNKGSSKTTKGSFGGLKISGKMLRRVPSHGDRFGQAIGSKQGGASQPVAFVTSDGPETNIQSPTSSGGGMDDTPKKFEGYGNPAMPKKGKKGDGPLKFMTRKLKQADDIPIEEPRPMDDGKRAKRGPAGSSFEDTFRPKTESGYPMESRTRRASDFELTGRLKDQVFLKVRLPDGTNTIQQLHCDSRVYDLINVICKKRQLPADDYMIRLPDGGKILDPSLSLNTVDCDEVELSLSEEAVARMDAERAEREKFIPRKRRSSNPPPVTQEVVEEVRMDPDFHIAPELIVFSEITASQYKEFHVIKTNKHGTRQDRVMGIDREKIYNLVPKMATGFLSTKMAKRASRSIQEVVEVELERSTDPNVAAFYIKYGKPNKPAQLVTYHYEARNKREAAEIVAKVKFLKELLARYR